jgi:hypothetical protein
MGLVEFGACIAFGLTGEPSLEGFHLFSPNEVRDSFDSNGDPVALRRRWAFWLRHGGRWFGFGLGLHGASFLGGAEGQTGGSLKA